MSGIAMEVLVYHETVLSRGSDSDLIPFAQSTLDLAY